MNTSREASIARELNERMKIQKTHTHKLSVHLAVNSFHTVKFFDFNINVLAIGPSLLLFPSFEMYILLVFLKLLC